MPDRGHSKCKMDSEVRGHTASGHGQPGRSNGASLCDSEMKDRIWPQDSMDQPSAVSTLSQPLSVSLHQVLSQAGAKKYQLGDLWGNGLLTRGPVTVSRSPSESW